MRKGFKQLVKSVAEQIIGIWTFTNGIISNIQTAGTTAYMTLTGNTIQAAGSDANVNINLTPKGTGVNKNGPVEISKNSNNYLLPALKIVGQSMLEAGSATNGVFAYLVYNAAGNRQLVFVDSMTLVGIRFSSNTISGFNISEYVEQDLIFNVSSKNVGINTSAPAKKMEINSADGNNLRLTYNDSNGSAANYADLLTTSAGNLQIEPSSGIKETAGLKTKEASVVVPDDGTITLPTGATGLLEVWTEAEYGTFYITATAVVSIRELSANTINTNTDGKLCAYNGGSNACIIKNALGSEKTVSYVFKYR